MCDRRINERLKFEIHLNVVLPVTLYDFKCWLTTKGNENRLALMTPKTPKIYISVRIFVLFYYVISLLLYEAPNRENKLILLVEYFIHF